MSLDNLAVLYSNQGKYAEAEPLYQRSMAIREKGLGPDHPAVATSLHNLAGFYANQRKYAEAQPLCQRALAILELSQTDAEKRVNDVFAQAQQAADRVRKAAAHPMYWTFLALLVGTFCAALRRRSVESSATVSSLFDQFSKLREPNNAFNFASITWRTHSFRHIDWTF